MDITASIKTWSPASKSSQRYEIIGGLEYGHNKEDMAEYT